MEFVNADDDNSFDPTPKLKSSPILIKFISFDMQDNCIYCGEKYTRTILRCYRQKYCKKCLSSYIAEIKCLSNHIIDITDNNIYLDVYLYTRDIDCIEHEIDRTKQPQNIQECCRNCLEILLFKQISTYYYIPLFNNVEYYKSIYDNVIESEKYCKLCGKSLCQESNKCFKLCSDCYLISFGYIKSTLIKN